MDPQVSLTLTGKREGRSYNILASIEPLLTSERGPLDICCVVDISGSMDSRVSVEGAEDAGLSVLDIVKHAVNTIMGTLQPIDRLGLVSYSDTARVEFGLTNMDDAGKSTCGAIIGSLRTEGSTNLWDGLLKGMEVMKAQTGNEHRARAVFLLTDGVPNVEPPKPYLAMMRDFKDSLGTSSYPGTICTFGFGYNLLSNILIDIALEGGGSYAFIPDGGFVGTIFVNALSNQLVSFSSDTRLAIEVQGGATLIPDSLTATCSSVDITSWGASLSISSLPINQRRDFFFTLNLPDDGANDLDLSIERYVTTSLTYQPLFLQNATPLTVEATLATSTVNSRLYFEAQGFRERLIRSLMRGRTPETNDPESLQLAADMESWIAHNQGDTSLSPRADGVVSYVKDLREDLIGQVSVAFSKANYYQKWGKHYLPSLCRAHQLQQCNNFKDPGVQHYGGALFNRVRDAADDIFMSLPPPTPTAPSYDNYGGGGGGGTQSAPVNMRAFYNAAAGCLDGDCSVSLSNGDTKKVRELQRGDQVACNLVSTSLQGDKLSAAVECVVKMKCGGSVDLVETREGLRITPWHPIFIGGKWQFPADLSGAKLTSHETDAVFNFVLGPVMSDGKIVSKGGQRGVSLVVSGVECIALAHGITGDAVAEHSFYGTDAVVKSLKSLGKSAYEVHGCVEIEQANVVRDNATGLVCDLIA